MAEFRFPAKPSSLADVRRFVREHATGVLADDEAEELVAAVSEAVANAVRHAGSRSVEVAWSSSEDHVAVTVRDDGVFGSVVSAEPYAEGGYGLPLMMAFVDEVHIRRGRSDAPGTVVRLVKRRLTHRTPVTRSGGAGPLARNDARRERRARLQSPRTAGATRCAGP